MSRQETDGHGSEESIPAPDLSSLLASLTREPSAPDLVDPPSGSDQFTDHGTDQPGDLKNLDIDVIVPNEFQPRRRFDEDAMISLTDSVKALGVLQPVLVRPMGDGRYELIAGERRWRAARRAHLPKIPAVVRTTDDKGSLEQAIVENLHRADLNALEEAAAYQQLIDDFALTQDEVAVRVGKSRSAISNTLRLFQLPGAVQRSVASGELSAGHARAILGLYDPQRQREVAELVLSEGLSVRQVEELVKAEEASPTHGSGQSRSSDSGGSKKSVTALEVERLLADRLATKVEVLESSGTGRLVIRFADGEDLARIFDLLHGG